MTKLRRGKKLNRGVKISLRMSTLNIEWQEIPIHPRKVNMAHVLF